MPPCCRPRCPTLDIVPATVDLSAAEIELVGDERRHYRLREAFADPDPAPTTTC